MRKRQWFVLTLLVALFALVACSNNEQKEGKEDEKAADKPAVEEEVLEAAEGYTETKGQSVTYYTMDPDDVFGSTATIIEKDGKGILVDTQFSKEDVAHILKVAEEKGVEIETIYISYSDPDFYFGTNEIVKKFPDAKVVATPATIERIQNTYEAKLAVWADTLKDGAPDEIVLPEVVEDAIVLGDTTFTIFGDDLEKQTLYNEADDLFLGGILVSTGSHLFMADTKTIESQQQWVKDLEQLEQANPKVVIPGHFEKGNAFQPDNITFTKEYIQAFIQAEQETETSAELIEKMKDAYPDLDDGSLEMSAQVVKGEMEWE